MNFKKNIFIALAIICLAFTSCQKDVAVGEDAIINIPSTSSSVTAFDIKALMEKSDFTEIQKMPNFKSMINDAVQGNSSLAALLTNTSESGVDLNEKVYLSTNPTKEDMAYNTIFLSLKDKDAFKTLMTSSSSKKVSSGEGYEYFSPEKNVMIGWNDELAVIALALEYAADLETGIKNAFSTTKETSVAGDSNLQKCLSKAGDVVSWLNSASMVEEAKGNLMIGFAGITPEMIKGNYAHSYINFENGEIVSDSEFQINDELSKKYKHIFKDQVKTDFSKYIPSENLAFAVTTGIDARGINMILEQNAFVLGMANTAMREYGLTIDGLTKTFDGDLLMSGYRVEGQEDPISLMAMKISDKEKFQELIDLGIEYDALVNKGNGVYDVASQPGIGDMGQSQLFFDGEMAFMGDGTNIISKIQSGEWSKMKGIGGDVKKIVSGNIMGMFADFQTITKLADMGNIDLSGIKNGVMRMDRDDSSFKIDMADKSTNSLKSIFQMLNDNYKK